MSAQEISIRSDQLVSRSFILKHFNISCGMLKKYQVLGPVPFPAPVIRDPHARWSVSAINRWLGQQMAQPVINEGKYEIVLFVTHHPTEEECAAFSRAFIKVDSLMEYITQFELEMNESLDHPENFDWETHLAHELHNLGSDLLSSAKIPRHHPDLVELIKSLPEAHRLGMIIERIPFKSYSIYVDDLRGDKLLPNHHWYSVDVINRPEVMIANEVKVPLIPVIEIGAVLDRYRDLEDPAIRKLIAEMTALMTQE